MLKRGKFVDVSERAIVSLIGSESLDLLQRISTNDVARLNAGGSVQTVLANEKGRIVEVVSVLLQAEEGLLVIGQSTDPLITKEWIEKYIIMEDITIKTLTSKVTHFMIYDSMESMHDLMLRLPLDRCQVFEETLGSAKLGHVLARGEFRDIVIEWLLGAGFAESESNDYEEHRITHGIPAFPSELSSSYNPLEAGLVHLVSFTKGCYIGQEVVARLDTYKKLQRRLVRLRMSELPTDLPQKIYLKNEECGIISSAVRLRDSRECLGLGYVKTGSETSSEGLYFNKGGIEIKLVIDSRETEAT
jgi:tRNA-modifying protein YgfZ